MLKNKKAKSGGKKKKNASGKWLIFFSILFLLISFFLLVKWYEKRDEKENDAEIIAKKIDLEMVRENYHEYVKMKNGAKLYQLNEGKYQEVSVLYGGIEFQLDNTYEVHDEYFKVLNSDYYVIYDDVEGIEALSNVDGEYKYYKNYIVYNENIILKDKAKLYVNDSSYFEVTGGSYPIIIKDIDRYGIEYQNRLVYVSTSDVESVVENINTDQGHTDGLSVLNYHYVVSATNENGELSECQQSICITDTMFDSHVKYLKDNGYYAVSMRDLELFIDGKIQLPERSVSLTFDDGWYVTRTITILEKYQMLGTLFLIGSLASSDAYRSSYLEIHSHTWDMHGLKTGDDCPNSSLRGGITCFDDEKILEDLKKSRESLNNTTYFCYPFYDYNERAISLLQQAGFTMAFAGELGDSKVRVGQNKFKIPRYVIISYTTMDQFIRYVS